MNSIPDRSTSRRRFLSGGLLVATALGCPRRARAAPRGEIRFAIAHDMPRNSSIPVSLQVLSRRWMDVLNNRLELNLMPPIPGGETVLLRRIGINQIQGAFLSATGLAAIDPSSAALQALPLLFGAWNVVDDVHDQIRPALEKRLLEQGYEVILWAHGGWLRWFSTRPVASPAHLRALRVAGDAWLPSGPEAVKVFGNAIVVPPEKLGTALATGEVEAVLAPTARAVDLGIAKSAKYLLDLRWAPLVHALVLSRKAWERVPSEIHSRVRVPSDNVGHEIRANLRAEDEAAITRLTDQFGLRVVSPDGSGLEAWRRTGEEIRTRLRGTAVSEGVQDEILKALKV